MPNAFGNTNQNQFGSLNFTDWSQVGDMFGPAVVNALQQNNVSLDQVGSVIGGLGIAQQTQQGQVYGAGNPQFVSSGFTLADAINSQLGGGSGGSQQPGGTINLTGWQNPFYGTNLLGAQALEAVGLNPSKTMLVNPTPGQDIGASTQFAKSGVSNVGQPQAYDISQAPMPKTGVPSVFTTSKDLGQQGGTVKQGGINWTPKPTDKDTIPATPQFNAAPMSPGTPYAAPPTVQSPAIPSTLPPAPAAPAGTPGMNYANTATGVTQGIPPGPGIAMFHPDINPTGPNPTRPGLTSARM